MRRNEHSRPSGLGLRTVLAVVCFLLAGIALAVAALAGSAVAAGGGMQQGTARATKRLGDELVRPRKAAKVGGAAAKAHSRRLRRRAATRTSGQARRDRSQRRIGVGGDPDD